MIPTELNDVLVSDPETLSGALRFKGTRVPVQALLDTLTGGETLDYFLDDFPDVTREQAHAVVRWEQNEARKTLGLEMAISCES